MGSAQTGSRKLEELADGAGKTPRPWEESGAARETQCSLTKAVTRAYEIQMPRRGLRPRAPGGWGESGQPVFALVGSPVYPVLVLCLMECSHNLYMLQQAAYGLHRPWALNVCKGITCPHVHETRKSLYHERMNY